MTLLRHGVDDDRVAFGVQELDAGGNAALVAHKVLVGAAVAPDAAALAAVRLPRREDKAVPLVEKLEVDLDARVRAEEVVGEKHGIALRRGDVGVLGRAGLHDAEAGRRDAAVAAVQEREEGDVAVVRHLEVAELDVGGV